MKAKIVSLLMFALCLLSVEPAFSRQCSDDNECPKKKVCHESRCIKVSKKESLVQISLEEWVAEATVYIDDIAMGNTPWEGIISAGTHTIRIEAPGYETLTLTGEARSGARETIQVRLKPIPAPVAPPQPQETEQYPSMDLDIGEEEESDQVGMIYIGLLVGGGYGVAKTDIDKWSAGLFLSELTAGVAVVRDPVLFELGAVFAYGAHFIKDIPAPRVNRETGEEEIMPTDRTHMERRFGALPRLLFPVVEFLKDSLYIGFEVEFGMTQSYENYFYTSLRGDIAFFVHKNIEIRINPFGLDWMRNFKQSESFIGYIANAGIAVRFL
ncbi:MAG: PEGA domain-containing protein [Proteobacteria bacterium]|nr:PEGA domain-containing protein [Pseudomonadota bacterium]